jgi:hypothetical protein
MTCPQAVRDLLAGQGRSGTKRILPVPVGDVSRCRDGSGTAHTESARGEAAARHHESPPLPPERASGRLQRRYPKSLAQTTGPKLGNRDHSH